VFTFSRKSDMLREDGGLASEAVGGGEKRADRRYDASGGRLEMSQSTGLDGTLEKVDGIRYCVEEGCSTLADLSLRIWRESATRRG
jgi:hypothetical protein